MIRGGQEGSVLGSILFGIETDVPQVGGNAAQRREHDKRRGAGTMSRSGAQCPCCPTIMSMEDIRYEGRAGRLGAVMTAVVVDGAKGKEYRLPTEEELRVTEVSQQELAELYEQIPFGLPEEPLPPIGTLGFRVQRYGFDQWAKLFTERQLLCLGSFVGIVRELSRSIDDMPEDWREAVITNLALVNDRIADRGSTIAHWDVGYEKIANTFAGFRLPISWDFSETAVLSETTGAYSGQLEWVARYLEHGQNASVSFGKSHAAEAARLTSKVSTTPLSRTRPITTRSPIPT